MVWVTKLVFGYLLHSIVGQNVQEPSSGCTISSSIPTGETFNYTFVYDGKNRTFAMYLPSNYYQSNGSTNCLPIVYALPGYTISLEYFVKNYHLQTISEKYGFIGVMTIGETFIAKGTNYTVYSWNDLSCTGSPHVVNDSYTFKTCNQSKVIKSWNYSTPYVPGNCSDDGYTDVSSGKKYNNVCNFGNCKADDIGYLKALTKYIEEHFCIDTIRQYLLSCIYMYLIVYINLIQFN